MLFIAEESFTTLRGWHSCARGGLGTEKKEATKIFDSRECSTHNFVITTSDIVIIIIKINKIIK